MTPDRDINVGRITSLHHIAGPANMHDDTQGQGKKKKRPKSLRQKQQQIDELLEEELSLRDSNTDNDSQSEHIDFHA